MTFNPHGNPMASHASIDTSASNISSSTLFEQLEAYPWDADAEFQHGLQSILSSSSSSDQAEHLTLRAKCFYYARKTGTPVDFEAYKEWRERSVVASNGLTIENLTPSSTQSARTSDDRNTPLRHETSANSNEPPAPYPNTFSQIVELISSGQPIPGIKEVPNTVLEGQASRAVAGKRRKPWEKGDQVACRGTEATEDVPSAA